LAPSPFLIFGHGKAIHRMDLDGRRQRRLVAGVGSSIIVDFDYREESGNCHDDLLLLQKVFSSDKHISGLAVDWLWNRIYWTSGEKGKIRRVDTNGKNEKTVLRHLTQPSSIAVDPTKRFLFWLSGGMSSSIQRSNSTGHTKTTLIKINGQLKALSIDYTDKRLFWVQFGLQGEGAIGSCDYNGKVVHIINHQLCSFSLGISIFRNTLFYNDYESHDVKSIQKYGGEYHTINKKPLAKPPVDIKVVHLLNQPLANTTFVCTADVNECAHWNHGCSLGCENAPGSYFCTCPEGYTLLPDKKSCQGKPFVNDFQIRHTCTKECRSWNTFFIEEGGTVLWATCCSSADRGGCSQLCSPLDSSGTSGQWQCGCLPGYELQPDGKQCTAFAGPAPFLLVQTLVDVRRVRPDGAGEEILLSESTGRITALDFDPVRKEVNTKTLLGDILGERSRETVISDKVESIHGLAVDWVHRRMYWTDQSSSSVDRSLLTGLNRETVISEGLQQPKAIAVHPLEKRLFWTDVGPRPAVESASLEGQGRAVVASTDLVSPSGLCIDFAEEQLFWCDVGTGRVETARLDGSQRRTLLEKQVGFGLAVFEQRLWVSEQESHTLRSFHKRTGKELRRLHSNMVQPAAIVVIHPLAKPVCADVCLHKNGGCAQLCESKLGSASCSCLPHYSLSADGTSCSPLETATNSTGLLFHEDGDGPPLISNVTPGYHNNNVVEKCPSSHDSYCLYQGCVPGYMGERCQFSDLEWWGLQQAEEQKKRNVTLAACMVGLISLLAIAACVTYCYG
uniref:Epidermal growth factor n=1 Tax=Neogobius melanostomus TaxID=47308 RepID=A0A8C6TG68_9GOBI